MLTLKSKPRSTQLALAPSLLVGQVFGLMPVVGLFGETRFKRKSLRFVYSVVCAILCMFQTSLHIAHIFVVSEVKLFDYVDVIFHVNSTLVCCYFLNLSTKWPSIMKLWNEVDAKLERRYGFPMIIRRSLFVYTSVAVTAGVLEHVLYITYTMKHAKIQNLSLEKYWMATLMHYFRFLPFHVVIGAVANFTVFVATFAWNYADLFIVLVSTALTERFVQIRRKLEEFCENGEPNELFWKEVREDYCLVSRLAADLDSALGNLILLSYTINLFIVLIQLLHSFDSKAEFKLFALIYFIYSFGLLLVRIAAVTILASGIYAESMSPLDVLFQLRSDSYNVEVERLILHIKMKPVCFSGRGFFQIRRSLILGIVGAVMSYELILIQFNFH